MEIVFIVLGTTVTKKILCLCIIIFIDINSLLIIWLIIKIRKWGIVFKFIPWHEDILVVFSLISKKWTKKVIWWRKIKIRPVAPFVGIKTEQQICKTMLGKCICNILRGVNIFWSYICRIHVRHHLVGICVALSVKIYWWYFDLLHIAVFRIVGSMQCFTQKNVSIHHDLFYE